MKKIQVLAVAACVLAIGSAFASKNVAHKNTFGQYWDGSKCVAGQSTFTCDLTSSKACTDITTGIQIADGTSPLNPCGNLLFHP
jgi:hypothetical protein